MNYKSLKAFEALGETYTNEKNALKATGLFTYSEWDIANDFRTSNDKIVSKGKNAGQAVIGAVGTVGGALATGSLALACPGTGIACAGAVVTGAGTGLSAKQAVDGVKGVLGTYESNEGKKVLDSYNPNRTDSNSALTQDGIDLAVTAGEAALAIVGGKVVTKYGGAAIDAAKDIKRILQNDPAKLVTVKASTSGNISAKQISENGKIIDPPQEVLNKQKELLSNRNNTQTGILREEIANSYFKNSGYPKLESKCGSNCFDGVYIKNGELYIVEVKPLKERGSVKLNSANQSMGLDLQMSDEWIKSRANELSSQKNNSIAQATGDKILQAIESSKPVNKIVVGVNEGRAVTINLGNNVK